MATYYISASGNDTTGTGTSPGSPWATLTKAATVAAQGDVVNVNRGSTINDTNPTFAVGITLQPYGSGSNPTIALGTSHLLFNDAPSITLTNINFTNSSTVYSGGSSTEIVRINRTATGSRLSGITISGCSFSNGQNGLRIYTSTVDNGGYNNISISGCVFHDCSLTGMYIHGAGTFGTNYHYSAVTITNNVAYNINGSTAGSGSGYGWGLNVDNLDTAVGANIMSGNNVHDCGSACYSGSAGGGVGIQVLGTNGLTVSGNAVANIQAVGVNDGSGIDVDLGNDNIIVERNFIYGCGGGGLAFFTNGGHSGNVFRFNAVIDCGKQDQQGTHGGIALAGGNDANPGQGGLLVHNNTVTVTSANPAISCYFAPVAKKFYNNILVVASGSPAIYSPGAYGAGTAFDHNYYQQTGGGSAFKASINGTTYSSFSTYQSGTSQDANSVVMSTSPFVGPLSPIPAVVPGSFSLDTPYWLTLGSTPQAAGANLQSLYSINPGTTDLNSNSIPVPYSAGAINPAYVALSPRMAVGSTLMMAGF